ncbi:MAG TPA: DUF2442 domain-containing protein [Candidatus Cryptobacteroides intestinipullorum]|nr:DUF2442 domain-containing protein [Candidatus Cryptobacteroides intestinipullorum]
MIHIKSAKYVSGYILELTFDTGEVKRFDFSSLYNEGICRKLQDMSYFKNFTLDGFTVDWNNEIGFAPEYLYENGVPA